MTNEELEAKIRGWEESMVNMLEEFESIYDERGLSVSCPKLVTTEGLKRWDFCMDYLQRNLKAANVGSGGC